MPIYFNLTIYHLVPIYFEYEPTKVCKQIQLLKLYNRISFNDLNNKLIVNKLTLYKLASATE